MTLALQEILSALTQSKIDLVINSNRSTMISVLERKRKYVRLSIHQMFLDASNEVIEALVLLLKNKRNKSSNSILHRFIEQNSKKYDSKLLLNKEKLLEKGDFHNLAELYQKTNQTYFSSELNLHITWFGTKTRIPKRQITFGLYYESLKLVKINRLLDQLTTPKYFIEYIIYHEMLHELYRPKINSNGYRSIHTKEFREKEKLFLQYTEAKTWENQFKKTLFR